MKKKILETIIIGGGISGLSCARRLYDKGKGFLLITKDIGGRMLAADGFGANYGAAYITENYSNVLKYVEKGEPMRMKDFYFFDGKSFSNLLSWRNFRNYFKIFRILWLAWRISNHLKLFREKADHKSMEKCFEEDPFLMKYWLMSAGEFVKKYKLQRINHYFIDPITASTAFVHSARVNSIYLVSMVFPAILKSWSADFTNTEKKLTQGYRDRIKIGTVTKVKKNEDGNYNVISTIGNYISKNVVFAAPQKNLSGVYKLPTRNIQQDIYVFNIRGERNAAFKNKKAIVFQPKYYDLHMIWEQSNGSDIIYTLNARPDFSRYYRNYKIIKKIHWQPAMIIPTCCLIEQDMGENLYLASDYNASGLEDSFLSGLYAANQILGNS